MISQAKQNGNHIKLPLDFKVNKGAAIAPFRRQSKLCMITESLANIVSQLNFGGLRPKRHFGKINKVDADIALAVIPAKAKQRGSIIFDERYPWTPASAGMTIWD